MRRFTVLFALLTVLVSPAAASAGTVILTDYTSGYFANGANGGGGPFLATTTGGPLGNASFLTFCLEASEHFSYAVGYSYTLNDGAIRGGVAGQTSPNYDPLSDAAKWLYYQAVSGDFSSWYASVTGNPLNADAGAGFQYALWYLENEKTAGQIPTVGLLLANYAIANQGNWSLLFADGHRVYAMNIVDGLGGVHQDQFAYQRLFETPLPVPEPASLALLGAGLLIVSRQLLRRRRKA